MEESSKRKERPDGSGDGREVKRSKGGTGGKWQTPHQQAKAGVSYGNRKIEPGDMGIWATCAKGQEGRATEELKAMFEECAEKFYDISVPGDDEDDSVDDIETSIKKEVAAIGNKQRQSNLFSPIRLNMPCVLFFKTRQPIDPAEFVHKICIETISKTNIRKMRYINRLTPMTLMGKATEKGLEEVAKAVLGSHFTLRGNEQQVAVVDAGNEGSEKTEKTIQPHSYAIRLTTRNHNTLKRDVVIQKVASLIAVSHKVDLTAPDKVIIVEICQTVCGMSVVAGDWESLKRFNLAELYQHQPSSKVTATSKG